MKYKHIVTTLYEGHFHYGVAALINSLISTSFEGCIMVGYRGEMPFWVEQLKKNEEGHYFFGNVTIQFEKIVTDLHFGYYKPSFLKKMLQDYPTCEKVYYFDPDIVVNAPWSFFSTWVESGVALCLDVCFSYLHENHPWRKEWKSLWNEEITESKKIDFYVNSGFIGLKRQDINILETWIKITEKYKAAGRNITLFEQSTAHSAFKGDQDLLNAAITVMNDVNFSIIGTEGMGFTQPAYLMSHALGGRAKPWRKKYILSLIEDRRPSLAETDFFNYTKYPLKLFSNTTLFLKKADLKVAKLFGRIIG